MDETAIRQYLLDSFDDVQITGLDGMTFYFYGADRMFPFATLVTRDSEYERAFLPDLPGVFRLNIGVSRETYRGLFGLDTPKLGEAGVVDTGHDFTVLDQLLPHPVYAPQSWVCVLNPSVATFTALQPLLAEAYERAVLRETRTRPVDEE